MRQTLKHFNELRFSDVQVSDFRMCVEAAHLDPGLHRHVLLSCRLQPSPLTASCVNRSIPYILLIHSE